MRVGTNIRCLLQDAKGFLWVGTQDGLFRFDAKNIKEYNTNRPTKNLIGGSDIREITEVQNAVWITSTQSGLDKISVITSYPEFHIPQNKFPGLGLNTITSLQKFSRSLFIGSENGLYLYSEKDGHTSQVDIFRTAKTPIVIDKLSLYNHYLIIFIRNEGLVSYNIETNQIVDSVKAPAKEYRFYSTVAYSANEWLTGTSSGIGQITINKNGELAFTQHPFPYVAQALHTDIYGIAKDLQGNIWFSTDNNLFKVDVRAGKHYNIQNALADQPEITNNIYRIYCDSQNNIWLGCQTGLFLLENHPALARTFYRSWDNTTKIPHAYYLYLYSDTMVLVTAESGLYEVNTNTNIIKEIDITQPYDFVFHDPYNNLIVSNKTGLKKLSQKKLTPIQEVFREFIPYSNFTINSAVRINDRQIVMGSENNKGVLVWDFIHHNIEHINTKSGDVSLDSDVINSIFKIRSDVFCVLTEVSLIYFDLSKRIRKKIPLSKNTRSSEYGLFFDMCAMSNTYYLSSYGNGVLVLDTTFKLIKTISVSDGLSNNSVYKLLPWKDSLLFMSTNFGLNILNIKTGKIQQLFKSDGLHDNVFEETSGNIFSDIIYVGGLNGFTAIYPHNLKQNQIPPVVYINNISITLPKGITFDSSNLETTHFFIPHDALQTNIYFSAIRYSNPERMTFSYKITERHKDWINNKNQHFVSLINPASGSYHLQVRVANEDGVWSEVKEFMIKVEPKWYQSWWFAGLCILVAIVIIYTLYRLRLAQLKKEENIRRRLASDLHDDLGSTLNSIKVFSNLALMEADNRPYLIKIKESTQDAITGIRDIIWILDDKKDTVEHLLTRVSQFAAPLCEAGNIRFEQCIDEDAYQYKLAKEEKRNLYMIMKEAINNSIKYAGCSRIELAVSVERKKRLKVTISDNGKGFDTSNTTEGNGLKNIASRSKEIRYRYIIKSTPGQGTTTTLFKT